MKVIQGIALALLLLLFSCNNENAEPFAYNGRLDADVVRLSAQLAGTIDSLTVDEGDAVQQGQLLVKIDDRRVKWQLKQQQEQLAEIEANLQSLQAKMEQVQARLKFSLQTLKKTQAMHNEGVATQQQVDELQSNVDVLQAQLKEIQLNKQRIASKRTQLKAAMELTKLNIKDARVLAPFKGLVINRFVHRFELASPGLPLLEIADLSHLEATIYVPLKELNAVKIGQKGEVHIDGTERTFTARVKWISPEAEFTPKTILTRETRTALVYAVKLDVPNPEGILKIGMPVEVIFKQQNGHGN